MSLCDRTKSSTSLQALSLFQRVMDPRFVVAVRVSAEGSIGCKSPVSRCHYAFERYVAVASMP